METIFFWIAWGLISFWALKTFYYSFSKKKLNRLRKAAFGINLAVFVLTFLPWLPPLLGGSSGLMLAWEGNIIALLFVSLLVVSMGLFCAADASLLKLASIATIVNSFVLFILMIQLRPGTFILSFYDIAPIIAVLFLLMNNVIVLFLWQQLELKS
jgi:hypothetical protein